METNTFLIINGLNQLELHIEYYVLERVCSLFSFNGQKPSEGIYADISDSELPQQLI